MLVGNGNRGILDIIKLLVLDFVPVTHSIRHYVRLILVVSFLGQASTICAQVELLNEVVQHPEQVVYPYNPDEDNSGAIGAADLLPFLIAYGNPAGFYQSEESQDPLALQNVIAALATLVLEQQLEMEALQQQLLSHEQGLQSLAPLLTLVPVATTSTVVNNTWQIAGLNVQLLNGASNTYGTSNGLGNLILGYNEVEGGHHLADGSLAEGEVRTGSHNLVIGSGHSYAANGAIVGGLNNTSLGHGASLLSGQSNLAGGTWSAVLGGLDNRSTGLYSCISGGHSNTASGDRASVSGGLLNLSSGIATSILGGQYLQVTEQYETASGQYDIND